MTTRKVETGSADSQARTLSLDYRPLSYQILAKYPYPITGGKFEQHHSNISRNILDSTVKLHLSGPLTCGLIATLPMNISTNVHYATRL